MQAPQQKVILKESLARHPLRDSDEFRTVMAELWEGATHREERYAAIAVAGPKRCRAWQTPDMLSFYRRMVAEGAWRDFTDSLAPRVGELLPDHRGKIRRRLVAFSGARNMWTRRLSIIAQLALKAETDEALLYGNIGRNWHDGEFFIRKAIGWALRNHSNVDPDGVTRFIQDHSEDLSPLSQREAMKHLERKSRERAT